METLRSQDNSEGLTTPAGESTGNVSSPVDEALPEGMTLTVMPGGEGSARMGSLIGEVRPDEG